LALNTQEIDSPICVILRSTLSSLIKPKPFKQQNQKGVKETNTSTIAKIRLREQHTREEPEDNSTNSG